jgi:hypothetical protein
MNSFSLTKEAQVMESPWNCIRPVRESLRLQSCLPCLLLDHVVEPSSHSANETNQWLSLLKRDSLGARTGGTTELRNDGRAINIADLKHLFAKRRRGDSNRRMNVLQTFPLDRSGTAPLLLIRLSHRRYLCNDSAGETPPACASPPV